jgi:predicted acetyltransferase
LDGKEGALPTSQTVTLEKATRDMAALISNLLELYMHDLSEIFPIDVGPDGRFGYGYLPLYWSEPGARYAFLIKCGDSVGGFALASRGSPATTDPADLDVAEFFVLRRYRRLGVGRQAAYALWDGLPGRWVVRVSEANRAGLPFWSEVVRTYTNGACIESTRMGSPHNWRVFTFASTAKKPFAEVNSLTGRNDGT